MTYLVAFVKVGSVGAVLAVRHAVRLHPGLDFGPGNAQEGPQNQSSVCHATAIEACHATAIAACHATAAATRQSPASHTPQAPGSGASQKVEKQRLRVVVGIVGHGYRVEPGPGHCTQGLRRT